MKIVEIIKGLLAQLDSAVSDPVVKFLVISIAILIIVITFNIIINMLKGLFRALFCRKKKPEKKPKKQKDATQGSQVTNPDDSEKHLHVAQDALSMLKNLIASTPVEEDAGIIIPTPISSKEAHPAYTAETLAGLEYQVTNEDIENTLDSIAGKTEDELKGLLKDLHTKAKNDEFTVENDKAKFLKLIEERTSLEMLEEKAIEEYNQEVLKAVREIDAIKDTKNEAIKSLKNAESTLSDSIITYLETSAKLKQQQNLLAEQNIEVQQAIDNYKTTIDTLRPYSSALDPLTTFQKQAEKSTDAIKDNGSRISALIGSISATSKELSLNKLTEKTVSNQIEQLKAEEIRRIAEEKERAEAEAKAKALAIAEAKRKEEERLAAEKAEQLRIQEQQRLEAQRRLEEQRQQEELLARSQSQIPAASPDILTTNGYADGPLSPEEAEALQAKAMMDAQRERRRQAAQQKANPAPMSDTFEKVEKEIPKATETVEVIKSSEPPAPEPKISEPQIHDTDDPIPVNPMAAIEAEWAREREAKENFAAYQRARAEEIERRKAVLEAEQRKKSSSTDSNT